MTTRTWDVRAVSEAEFGGRIQIPAEIGDFSPRVWLVDAALEAAFIHFCFDLAQCLLVYLGGGSGVAGDANMTVPAVVFL